MRFLCYTDFGHQGASSGRNYLQSSCFPTVVNHLQVERLPFVHVVQVFYGNDEAELQDGQTWERTDQPSRLASAARRANFQLTVQHVRFGIHEAEAAGLQQDGRSDGRLGSGNATQTKQLRRREVGIRRLPGTTKQEARRRARKRRRTSRRCSEQKSTLEMKYL